MPLVGRDLVFVAVPKTGSVWVREVLMGQDWQLVGEGERHDPDGARQYGKPVITTVRHPRDWLPSAFRYASSPAHLDGPASVFHQGPLKGTFDDFAEWVTSRPGIIGATFRQFTEVADHVLRLDAIRDDLDEALWQIGVSFDPAMLTAPAENVTMSGLPAWDPDLLKAIEDTEAAFIHQWWPHGL